MVIGMDRQQDAAFAHPALVSLRFVLRNAHSNERSDDAAGSPADNVFYSEMKKRMAALEDSYNNAPRITEKRLEGWQAVIRIISSKVYGARETVELLNSEERDGTDFRRRGGMNVLATERETGHGGAQR